MALVALLTPPRNMILHRSDETKEEGLSPGLRYVAPKRPSDSHILLNATYNNYTITNHYKSKPQIEKNCKLKEEKRELIASIKKLEKKYNAAKKLLNRAMPLLKHVDMTTLDDETQRNIIEMKEKWETVTAYQNKRKMESSDDSDADEKISKKRNTTPI